jgi:hypothetical protein
MKHWLSSVAVAAALCASGAATAAGPAVSGLNGKLSAEAGVAGLDHQNDFAGFVSGSVTMPLGTSFGVQLDGGVGSQYGGLLASGGGHLFWRDPQQGLLGAMGQYTTAHHADWGRAGGEGEFYLSSVTLSAHAGYQFGGNGGGFKIRSGFYGGGDVTFYAADNLSLSLGGGSYAGDWSGRATIEFQPRFAGFTNMSLFANGEISENNQYKATAGVRFYFGADKSLIRRHREDDPQVFLFTAMTGEKKKNNCVILTGLTVIDPCNPQ